MLLISSTISIPAQNTMSHKIGTEQDSDKPGTNIAIATVEKNVTSKVSNQAGRAPYYLFFDRKGEFIKSEKNPAAKSRQGASAEVIDLLLKESCGIVIAGQFGNKMQNLLKQNNIKFYIKEGKADNVITTLLEKNGSI